MHGSHHAPPAQEAPPSAPTPANPFSALTNNALIMKVFGSKTAGNQKIAESLDYEPVQNKLFLEKMKEGRGEKKIYGYSGHTFAKFVVTLVAGVMAGCFAVALSKAVARLTEIRLHLIQSTIDGPDPEDPMRNLSRNTFVAFLYNCMYSSALVTLATSMVQYWAPAAAGAGVTLVMAYLNGNHVPNLLRWQTLVTKYVGTVCAVSAGLPMGPEGPMVHIGACCASVVSYFECNGGALLSCCFGRSGKLKDKLAKAEQQVMEGMKILDEIVSDADHREFVSAGSAAGISAAFGAPLGGVLFAMEEACTFWNKKTAWRCFIGGVLSTFTILQLNHSATHGMIGFSEMHSLENRDWISQLPFIVINAIIAGLLGAAFNSVRMWLWRMRAAKTLHCVRISEVVGLACLCVIVGFFFAATAGRCMPRSPEWEEDYGVRFHCEEGTHNDMATLFLSSNHGTIVNLISMGAAPGEEFVAPYRVGALAIYCLFYLLLMAIGAGLAIPGGLFMPSMIVGSAWGGLQGLLLRSWLPHWNMQPGVYALMAASGVLGGVFRSAISLVALVIEGSHGIEFLFGVVLSVILANWVAHYIHHDGVYESELERVGTVYMLHDTPPHRLHTISAEEVMAPHVQGFRCVETVATVLEVLRSTMHNGFPVFSVDQSQAHEAAKAKASAALGHGHDIISSHHAELSAAAAALGGASFGNGASHTAFGGIGGAHGSHASAAVDPEASKLVAPGKRLEGLILRSQLLVLLQRRHFCDAQGRPVGRDHTEQTELDIENEMRTFFRHYFTHSRYLSSTTAPLDALNLHNQGVDLDSVYIDMRPYMNRTPFTVRKDCAASRAHQAFIALGLRHLLVVDSGNNVVGMITRKDLDHAAGHGWWRVAAPAPKPESSGNLLANILTGRMFRRSKSAASVSDGGPAHSQSDSALLRGTGLANSSGGHH